MNDLDLQNRTRTFFSEIRRKYVSKYEIGPICNSEETLSDNINLSLKNWSEYQSQSSRKPFVFPTPDEDPILDKDLTLAKFVEVIYLFKHHKSPGLDDILNEDITSTILEESEDDPIKPYLIFFQTFGLTNVVSLFFNENKTISPHQAAYR